MTKRDWLSVGLRVAGVTVIVMTVLQTGTLFLGVASLLSQHEAVPWMAFLLGGVGLVVVIAAWLAVVRWADLIGRRLAPEEPATGSCEGPEGQKAILVLSMRVMGAATLIGLAGTIIQSVGSWQNLTPLIAERTGTTVVGWVVSSLVTWCLLIGMTLYLLFGSERLLWLAFPPEKPGDRSTTVGEQIPVFGSARNLFSMALRVMGLYLVLRHAVALAYPLLVLFFPATTETLRRPFNWDRFIESWLMVIAGVYFLTGGKWLVRLLFRERRDTDRESHEPAGDEAGS